MAWYDLDLGSLGLDMGSSLPALDTSQFNLSWPSGGNWFNPGDFNLGPISIGGDPPTGWPTSFSMPEGGATGGGGFSIPGGGFDDWMKRFGGIATLGKAGFDAYNTIERQKQMSDYNNAVQEYYRKQQDYLDQRRAWEANFVEQFQGAQEAFGEANAEFQGQISEAQGKAQEVMAQYLAAARPMLAQSQELLTTGVAALARGVVPEHWEPVLNEIKTRGTAAMVQSMVAAGMSPEEARAAAQPVVEQQAQTMLLQMATNMITSGNQTGQIGMAGLGGAGSMTEVMGKLAAMGMNPMTQEFQMMASVLGHILGNRPPSSPPPAPVA